MSLPAQNYPSHKILKRTYCNLILKTYYSCWTLWGFKYPCLTSQKAALWGFSRLFQLRDIIPFLCLFCVPNGKFIFQVIGKNPTTFSIVYFKRKINDLLPHKSFTCPSVFPFERKNIQQKCKVCICCCSCLSTIALGIWSPCQTSKRLTKTETCACKLLVLSTQSPICNKIQVRNA